MDDVNLAIQLENLKNCAFQYTESAQREMEKSHLNDEIVRTKILEAKKINVESPNFMIIHGDKTFEAKVEILEDNKVLVHSISYNKVMFVF